MKQYRQQSLVAATLFFLSVNYLFGQNPIIRNQYSADPTARVFGDRVYVFPSHDIIATVGTNCSQPFCLW